MIEKQHYKSTTRDWLNTFDFNVALTLSFNRKLRPDTVVNYFDEFCREQDRKHFGRYFYRKILGTGRPLAIGFIENKRNADEKIFSNRWYEAQLREFKQADRRIDPYNCLDEKDLETLRTNIVKRHVIGHDLGIADDLYTSELNDTESGRLVQLLGEDVMRFSQICIRVIERLERELLPHQFIARMP